MEFIIDFELVRKLAKKESTVAQTEIIALGIRQAFCNALPRHDAGLANAADANTLACNQGCSWCCHFSVDVRPVEVLNIVDYLRANFSDERIQQLHHAFAENSKVLDKLDEEQRMQHNIKCPFLLNERCSIYPVRPQTCRNYHATDSAGCKLSYEQPDNMDIAPEYAPITFQTGTTHVDAFANVMNEIGYDIRVYELNCAMNAALSQPETTLQRFLSKESVFPWLSAADVPLEFADPRE